MEEKLSREMSSGELRNVDESSSRQVAVKGYLRRDREVKRLGPSMSMADVDTEARGLFIGVEAGMEARNWKMEAGKQRPFRWPLSSIQPLASSFLTSFPSPIEKRGEEISPLHHLMKFSEYPQ
jgi:hypothetical protein